MLGGNMQVHRLAGAQIQFPCPLAGQLRPQPVFAQFAAAQAQPEEGSHELQVVDFGLEAVGVAVGFTGADDVFRPHRRPHRRTRFVPLDRAGQPRRSELNFAVADPRRRQQVHRAYELRHE